MINYEIEKPIKERQRNRLMSYTEKVRSLETQKPQDNSENKKEEAK